MLKFEQFITIFWYVSIISLSSLSKHIWRHWTYTMPIRCILSSVWVRFSIFPQLSILQYMGLCDLILPISPVMIARIYILCLIIIIIKSEVWTIIHCLGLSDETIVCAVCLSIFLLQAESRILIEMDTTMHVSKHFMPCGPESSSTGTNKHVCSWFINRYKSYPGFSPIMEDSGRV